MPADDQCDQRLDFLLLPCLEALLRSHILAGELTLNHFAAHMQQAVLTRVHGNNQAA